MRLTLVHGEWLYLYGGEGISRNEFVHVRPSRKFEISKVQVQKKSLVKQGGATAFQC